MSQTIRMCGIALCSAAIASALLSFISGGKHTTQLMRSVTGGYVILMLLSVLSGIKDSEFTIPTFDPISVDIEENQEDPVLLQAQDLLEKQVQQSLQENGIDVSDVTITLMQSDEGYVFCDSVGLLMKDKEQWDKAASLVHEICGILPQSLESRDE